MSQTIQAGPTPAVHIDNPLLNDIENEIEGQLTPDNRRNYLKIVTAGIHTAIMDGPKSIIASLRQSKDPVGDVARGAAAVVLMLRQEAKGVMPPQAMIPAGLTLAMKGLDAAEKMGLVKIDEGVVEQVAHIYTDLMFKAFGITPQNLSHASQKVHAAMQDPDTARKIQLKAGAIRDDGTPTPQSQTPPGVRPA
jgi:hypothetical protein